jgi:hypothetical protein
VEQANRSKSSRKTFERKLWRAAARKQFSTSSHQDRRIACSKNSVCGLLPKNGIVAAKSLKGAVAGVSEPHKAARQIPD